MILILFPRTANGHTVYIVDGNVKYIRYEDLMEVIMNEFGLQEYNDVMDQEHVRQVNKGKR
jgi:hypothetical protein